MSFVWEKLNYLLSLGALSLLAVHILRPDLGIDMTAVALLLIAAFPFASTFLKSLASSGLRIVEMPGGFRIKLADVRAATEKVQRGWASVQLPALQVSAAATVSKAAPSGTDVLPEDPIAMIREVASKDANLALVAFRIEIEKRIRRIAEASQLKCSGIPLSRLIRELEIREMIPIEVSAGLMDLVALGNRAAHGAIVDPPAADWVLDLGASTLLHLDVILPQPGSLGSDSSSQAEDPASEQ